MLHVDNTNIVYCTQEQNGHTNKIQGTTEAVIAGKVITNNRHRMVHLLM